MMAQNSWTEQNVKKYMLIQMSEIWSKGPIDQRLAIAKVISWYQISEKPSPEPIIKLVRPLAHTLLIKKIRPCPLYSLFSY